MLQKIVLLAPERIAYQLVDITVSGLYPSRRCHIRVHAPSGKIFRSDILRKTFNLHIPESKIGKVRSDKAACPIADIVKFCPGVKKIGRADFSILHVLRILKLHFLSGL